MRLDGLGKPPLVQSEDLGRAKVQEQNNIGPVAPIKETGQDGTLSSQNDGPKLGQILEIIQKAQGLKKKKPRHPKATPMVTVAAIRVYQRMMSPEEWEQNTGQTLDLKG